MKITLKNGNDARPVSGEYSSNTLVEFHPDKSVESKNIPANIVFLVDSSSSMQGDKWEAVKGAMESVLESLDNDDRIALAIFGTTAHLIFPLATLEQNRQAMKDRIEGLGKPKGVTNLKHGLETAINAFNTRDENDKTNRVNHVIMLTDGYPTDEKGYRITELGVYESLVKGAGATVTGIGLGSAEAHDAKFIQRLANLGKGSYYHAQEMTGLKRQIHEEIEKIQGAVAGQLTLKFSNVKSKVMRIAKVQPEIVFYDIPGNAESFEVQTGAMTGDLTSFLVQTNSMGDGVAGNSIDLFSICGSADGNDSDTLTASVKTSEKEGDLNQIDSDVLEAIQQLQISKTGEQIQLALEAGDKAKATKLIENAEKLAASTGQRNVTRALTKLKADVADGKGNADALANLQAESKKTKLVSGNQ